MGLVGGRGTRRVILRPNRTEFLLSPDLPFLPPADFYGTNVNTNVNTGRKNSGWKPIHKCQQEWWSTGTLHDKTTRMVYDASTT